MKYKCKYCKTTLSQSSKSTHRCSSMPNSVSQSSYIPDSTFTVVPDYDSSSSGSFSSSSSGSSDWGGGGGSFDGGGASGDW